MKTRFTALLIFLTGHLFAQDLRIPEYSFRLGLTAHPTIGWIKPEMGKTNSVALGFSYGLLADFNFSENYTFATGLTITTINGKSTEINVLPYYNPASSVAQTAYDLKYKLQYVEVPLTLKLKTDKIGEVRWYGQFGLSNGINIRARQSAETGNSSITDNKNISKEINFYRAGLILGAGGEFDVARHTTITAGLTLNNGFTDIADDKSRKVRNHYLGLNFGVFF